MGVTTPRLWAGGRDAGQSAGIRISSAAHFKVPGIFFRDFYFKDAPCSIQHRMTSLSSGVMLVLLF
jgi:hypothetical protein